MSQVGAAMAENMMQTPTGRFSKGWPEPKRFPQFLDKMGKMMSEDYDWSADIAKLPMPALLVFADNDSMSQKHVAEFFALLGGGVKAGLAEHATVRVAAGGCAWLQPLQFHNFGGGTAACRQVPGRSTHQCTNRRDTRLPGRPGPQQVLIGLLPPVRFNVPWPNRGDPAAMTHSKRAISSDIPASRTSHLALEA